MPSKSSPKFTQDSFLGCFIIFQVCSSYELPVSHISVVQRFLRQRSHTDTTEANLEIPTFSLDDLQNSLSYKTDRRNPLIVPPATRLPKAHLWHKTLCELAHNAASNQARSEPLRMGEYRLPIGVRILSSREPLRTDAQGGICSRMQDLHETIHSLPMESRPDLPAEEDKPMSHMRTSQELLPVLHAGPFLRAADPDSGRCAEARRTRAREQHQP